MAVGGNLDRLVSGLSINERHDLLEKLKDHSDLSGEPLYVEDKQDGLDRDIEAEYAELPWYSRLWYYLMSIFKSKSPIKVFEDTRIAFLGNKIDEKTPGLYDFHTNTLLPVFFRQLTRLKESSHFFYSALDSSVNRDKGAFFAFLGSLEMPEVHKALQQKTDPDYILSNDKDIQPPEMRQIALQAADDAFAMITESQRGAMYFNARSLNCLKELSCFLYDRVLMAFTFNNAIRGETCSAGVVRELLCTLNNILNSTKSPPPMTLLESLFVFILQEKAGEHELDIHQEIRLLLSKAESCLAVIREFNKQVPLTWILRCSTRNMSLSPKEVSGGEDWFVYYRDYWKKHTEAALADYVRNRRQRELTGSFSTFLKGASLKTLENTQTDENPEGLPLKGAFALSFLYTFYSVVFMPDINLILRPILIDGDFQRKENRIEFTEGYNNLIKLEDEIKKFERDISPTGDFGERYTHARQDMSALPVKRRKVQLVLEEAEEDAGKIIERAKDASQTMVNILGGILAGEFKGKYFTLSNLAKIVGKDNQFVADMNEASRRFQTVIKLLSDIEDMENGK